MFLNHRFKNSLNEICLYSRLFLYVTMKIILAFKFFSLSVPLNFISNHSVLLLSFLLVFLCNQNNVFISIQLSKTKESPLQDQLFHYDSGIANDRIDKRTTTI